MTGPGERRWRVAREASPTGSARRLRREERTIAAMVGMYCRDHPVLGVAHLVDGRRATSLRNAADDDGSP